MAYTVDQYNVLVAAIAQGAMTVKYADKEVTYRSLNDMYRIKRDMETQLFAPAIPAPTRRYGEFSKGLYPGTELSANPFGNNNTYPNAGEE